MSAPQTRRGFAARPTEPEAWIKAADEPAVGSEPTPFSARLTIDVTPALRGRIKIAAFARNQTAAAMLRELLERAFPETPADMS